VPKYLNNYSNPIYYGNTTFAPNQEVETYDNLANQANIVNSILETYNIAGGVNDVLLIRFNEETAWTTVTLTAGAARTAAQIVTDINTAYGSVVSYAEGGRVRISAPIVSNVLNAIYIATALMGSTAAATLGFATDGADPVAVSALQAFKLSQNAELYNVTTANNTFIFKVNNGDWVTATLTTGVGRTAAQIVTDINSAYEAATADATKVALAVIPVTIGGNVHVKLIAPIYNNFQSKLYIKSTGNTALVLLGFTGDNFDPVAESNYPTLVKTAELPQYNPIISETILTFAAAGTQYFYLTNPALCAELQFIRATIGAGATFTCYLESTSNTPPFTLKADETFGINLQRNTITKIIITASAAGNLTIRELKG